MNPRRLVIAFAALSLLAPTGIWGGALAAPWFLLTIVVALYGLRRLTLPRPSSIDERCIDAALLYLPIGGLWFVAARMGISIGGFGGTQYLLPTYTVFVAVHGLTPYAVTVVGSATEEWVLLGRDLINAHRILLDGPTLGLEIL